MRRLEELAYVLSRSERRQASLRALSVAAALTASHADGRGVPFCEEIVRRSFGLFFAQEAEKQREEKSSSVLVTPDDIRAEQARGRRVR